MKTAIVLLSVTVLICLVEATKFNYKQKMRVTTTEVPFVYLAPEERRKSLLFPKNPAKYTVSPRDIIKPIESLRTVYEVTLPPEILIRTTKATTTVSIISKILKKMKENSVAERKNKEYQKEKKNEEASYDEEVEVSPKTEVASGKNQTKKAKA